MGKEAKLVSRFELLVNYKFSEQSSVDTSWFITPIAKFLFNTISSKSVSREKIYRNCGIRKRLLCYLICFKTFISKLFQ